MGTLEPLRSNERLYQTNKIAKIYPNFVKLIEYKKFVVKQIPDLEGSNQRVRSNEPTDNTESDINYETQLRSIRRTKTMISDLVLCNEFDMFATFTFKSDRQDIDKCKLKMSRWLQSQQKKHGKFSYLIVPEFHKDRKSVHFHAMMKNYKGILKPAKNKKTNRLIFTKKNSQVYNISSYQLGYSTVIFLDDSKKVSSYIKKYITKDMPNLKSKQRYWSSQKLIRPETISLPQQISQITTNPFLKPLKIYENERYTISHINVTIKIQQPIIQGDQKCQNQNQKPKYYLNYHVSSLQDSANMETGSQLELLLQMA